MPAVNDLDRLGIEVTGPLERVILNHPSSKSIRSEDEIWDRIEVYLTDNNIMYAWLNPAIAPMDGMILWLPTVNVGGAYPEKNEELRKISDLASFLFDTLKLNKNCLHFNFRHYGFSGDGQEHMAFEAVDEVIFEELTGLPLPEEAKGKKIDRFRF